MKTYLLLLLIVISVFSCKKTEKLQGNNPPIAETKNTYTVDSASTQPGLFSTIKASRLITKDTGTVQLGVKSIFITKIDSFHYAFFTPVLSPGTYTLDLKNINSGNNPAVVIRDYTSISNSDEVISAVMKNYNNLADSLVKNSLNNAITPTDATFMHQLMDQLSSNIKLYNSEEKLLVAYQFQNMNLDNSFAKNANLDTSYLARPLGKENENGQIMLYKVIEAERAISQAFLASGGVYITGNIFSKTANIYTFVPFIVSVANFVYSIKAACKTIEEAISIIGFATNDITEINGKGTNANPVLASVGKILLETLQCTFRTLKKSDETNTNNDISNLIKIIFKLETQDQTLKSTYENIKSKFSNYFDKISINYSAYVSPVLTTAKEKIARVKSEFITVTNVSNSDISINATADGENILKLTFNNPSNNITTETDFTFQITYNQEAINNKVSITEHAKFKPAVKPVVTTTIPSSITATSAISGGIITNDGGTDILAKGITYYINQNSANSTSIDAGTGNNTFLKTITDLTPGKTYHVRAYATNTAGTGYGNDVSFITKDYSDWVGYQISPVDQVKYPCSMRLLYKSAYNVLSSDAKHNVYAMWNLGGNWYGNISPDGNSIVWDGVAGPITVTQPWSISGNELSGAGQYTAFLPYTDVTFVLTKQ